MSLSVLYEVTPIVKLFIHQLQKQAVEFVHRELEFYLNPKRE